MQWGIDLGNSLPKDAVGCEHLHVFKMRLDKLVGKKIVWINKYRHILFRKHMGLCSWPVLVEDGEGPHGPHSAQANLAPRGDDKG